MWVNIWFASYTAWRTCFRSNELVVRLRRPSEISADLVQVLLATSVVELECHSLLPSSSSALNACRERMSDEALGYIEHDNLVSGHDQCYRVGQSRASGHERHNRLKISTPSQMTWPILLQRAWTSTSAALKG